MGGEGGEGWGEGENWGGPAGLTIAMDYLLVPSPESSHRPSQCPTSLGHVTCTIEACQCTQNVGPSRQSKKEEREPIRNENQHQCMSVSVKHLEKQSLLPGSMAQNANAQSSRVALLASRNPSQWLSHHSSSAMEIRRPMLQLVCVSSSMHCHTKPPASMMWHETQSPCCFHWRAEAR